MDSYDSFVILAGQITAVNPAPSGCYLTLCNQDGFFPVQVNPALARNTGHLLCPAVRVCVTGRARSYYHQRRQANQMVIEAAGIAPVEEDELPEAGLLSLLKLTMAHLSQSTMGQIQLI